MKISTLVAAAVLALSGAAHATATSVDLDFSTYARGTQLTSLDGVAFSLVNQGAAAGNAAVGGWGMDFTGLSNTATGSYPTAQDLVFTFTGGTASNISFNFDNWGSNSSSYTMFDAANNVVGSGSVGNASGGSFSAGGTDVAKIVFDNGTGGRSSWEFAVNNFSATITPAVSAVPEGSSTTLMLAGMLVVGTAALRRQRKA